MNVSKSVLLVVLSCLVVVILAQIPVPVLIGFTTSTLLGIQLFSLAIVTNVGGISLSLNLPLGVTLTNYGYSKYDSLHEIYIINNINPPFLNFIDRSGVLTTVKTIQFGNVKLAGHHSYPVKSLSTVVAFDNAVNSTKEVNVYSVNYKRNDTRLLYAIGLTGTWSFQTKIPVFVDESAHKLYLLAKNSATNAGGVFVYNYASGQLISSHTTGTLFNTFVVSSDGSNLYGSSSNGYIMKFNFANNNGTVITSNWCSSTVDEAEDNFAFDLANDRAYSTIKCGLSQRLYTYDIYGNSVTYKSAIGFSNILGLQSLI